jgi:hypothetical protein
MYKCLPSLARIKDKPWAGEESGAADNLWWYQRARACRVVNRLFEPHADYSVEFNKLLAAAAANRGTPVNTAELVNRISAQTSTLND